MSARFSARPAGAAVPTWVTLWRRLVITNALRASIVRIASLNAGDRASFNVLPFESVTLLISIGLTRYPPLANTL
jgi:hypothetical protein